MRAYERRFFHVIINKVIYLERVAYSEPSKIIYIKITKQRRQIKKKNIVQLWKMRQKMYIVGEVVVC